VRRGAAFIPALAAMPEAEITALCDLDQEQLERRKEWFGNPPTFLDYEQMLDSGVDMVIVATPMHLHAPMCAEALRRDIHALSEVSAATSLEQCRELVSAVRSSNAKYMMAENCCYMKSFHLVTSMARAGVFGEIYYAEGEYVHEVPNLTDEVRWRDIWLFNRRGVTYPTHPMGPILDWMNDHVTTVVAMGTGPRNYPKYTGDDCSIVLCQTSRGGMIRIRNDMMSPRPSTHNYVALQGTEGAYEAQRHDEDSHRVCLRDTPRRDERRVWQSLWDFEDRYLGDIWRNPPAEIVRAGHDGSDSFAVLAFVEAILKDTEPPIDVYRALDFTVPGLMSEVSIRQGGAPVAVPNFRLM
jgi:predicted dehydrogenase